MKRNLARCLVVLLALRRMSFGLLREGGKRRWMVACTWFERAV